MKIVNWYFSMLQFLLIAFNISAQIDTTSSKGLVNRNNSIKRTYKISTTKVLGDATNSVTFSSKLKTGRNYIRALIQAKRFSNDDRVVDQKVQFIDENQNIQSTIKLGYNRWANISHEGNYAVLITETKEKTKEKPNGFYSIELFNEKGQRIWTKTEPSYWDATFGSEFIVSDYDGSSIAVTRPEGFFCFFSPKGDTIKTFKIFKSFNQNTLQRRLDCFFTSDGNNVVVGVTDKNGEIFQRNSGIIVFDLNGNEKWRYQAEETDFSEMYISPDSRYLISFHVNLFERNKHKASAYLLNMNGNLVKIFQQFGGIRFSSDGKYMAMDLTHNLDLIDTENGEILRSIQLDEITSMDIAGYVKQVAIMQAYTDTELSTGFFVYHNIKIFLYDFEGNQLWMHDFKDDKVVDDIMNISISDDGSEIQALLGSKLIKFISVKNN